MSPKTTSRRPRRKTKTPTRTVRKRPTRKAARAPRRAPSPPPEPEVVALAGAPEPAATSIPDHEPRALPAEVSDTAPELDYAARAPEPEPERPWPGSRRAVFFDVENTSHAPHVERTLRHLGLDRRSARTDFLAVGNWRVIGLDIGRILSRAGAQLVHSAPATGVRDWSDLRIAVSAGVWLGAARPGDRIEIVSDDRAFDAVGDVAAALGVEFHRLSHRALSGAPAPEPAPAAPAPSSSARHRGRRRRPYGRSGPAPSHLAAAPRPPAPVTPTPLPEPTPAAPQPAAGAAAPSGEPHTAPHDEIIHVVRELVSAAHGRPVLIDTLARELKRRGFGRTPGSPRLITRLRRIREISVSQTGMIALVGGSALPASVSPPVAVPAPPIEVVEVAEVVPEPELEPMPRAPELVDLVTDDDEGPQPGNERVPTERAAAPPRPAQRAHHGPRRRRRGGGQRPRPAPAS